MVQDCKCPCLYCKSSSPSKCLEFDWWYLSAPSWSRLHMISRLLGKKPRLALSLIKSSEPSGREGTLEPDHLVALECQGGCEPDCPLSTSFSYPEAGALADLEVCLASFKTFIIRLSFPLRFLRHKILLLQVWGSGLSALVLPPLASGPEGVCTDALLLFLARSRFSVDPGFRWRYFQQVAENGVTWDEDELSRLSFSESSDRQMSRQITKDCVGVSTLTCCVTLWLLFNFQCLVPSSVNGVNNSTSLS